MPETTEGKAVSLNQRRKLLHTFRKQYGITLEELGGIAGLSKAQLSRFEAGKRDLSTEAWARVLEKMSELVREGHGNLTWDPARRLAGIAKAKSTAARLGALVAQSIHSPALGDRLFEYALKPSINAGNYTPQELAAMCRELQEIAERAVHDNAILRDKLRFFEEERRKNPAEQRADRAEAQKENLQTFVEEHLPQIATGEAAKLAEKDKELALSKAAQREEMRRLGFKDGEV